MKKIFSIAIALFLSFALLTFSTQPIAASSQLSDNLFLERELEIEAELLQYVYPPDEDPILQSISSSQNARSLRSSVDLSTSVYFPPIQSQGSEGSCTAFSAAYYQFTYEANKLNAIPSTTSDTWYSPVWPYYAATSENSGSYPTFIYNFLKDHGTVKWNELTPTGAYQSPSPYPTDDTQMLNALKTRVSYLSSYPVNSNTSISDATTASQFASVKNLLTDGHVLRASSHFDFNAVDTGSNYIIYRCYRGNNSTHSFAIVGYDDNISYDVNGDGVIENSEKGAFKIANSWGTSYGYGGYAWILYDAMFSTSGISGSWESSYSSTRYPAFSTTSTTGQNIFNAITVSNYDVHLAAKASYTNSSKLNTLISISNAQSSAVYNATRLTNNTSSSFNIFYDYSPTYPEIGLVLNTTWNLNVSSTTVIPVVSLVDDRNNVIGTMSETHTQSGSSYNSTHSISADFEFGDVNYDGTLSLADTTALQRYLSDWDNLSTMQTYLADYNRDGTVSLADVTAIMNQLV